MPYEKRIDQNRQEEAREALSDYWRVDIHDMPKFYQCDWQIMRNDKTFAFAEFKWRSYCSEQIQKWGGYKLKLSKFLHGCQLLEWTGIPWLFIVDLSDGFFVYKMEAEVSNPESIGRFDTTRRNDKNDLEPAVMLNMEEFEKLPIQRD